MIIIHLFVITGISRGLGESLTKILVENQYKVIGIGRSFTPEQLENSDKVKVIKGDLSVTQDSDNILQALSNEVAKQEYESITLINNAGVIVPINKVGKLGKGIKSHININYLFPTLLVDCLINIYSKQIKIINISSGAAEFSIEGWSLYCSSKKAFKVFLDVVSKENGRVSVLNVDPGVMDTNMQNIIRSSSENQFPGVNDFIKMKEGNLLKNPDEVAMKILQEYIKE